MSRIIAIINQKGGTGKTTTAVNLSTYLAHLGHETLLVDLDPQGNASSGLGINPKETSRSLYSILFDSVSPSQAIRQTAIEWLDVIPSSADLLGAEVQLVNVPEREKRLKNLFSSLASSYRFVLMDCPPSLGLLTLNALVASEGIIVPIQCEYYALEGLGQLLKTVEAVRSSLNPGLSIDGVVLTMFDGRVNLANQAMEEIRKYFGDKVFKTIIPRNVRLAEAPGFGKPILLYDEHSRGAQAYRALCEEFLERQKAVAGEQTIA